MDCAERLVRAARHYERAVHILIRKRVKSVQNYMVAHLKIRNLVDRPPIGNFFFFLPVSFDCKI